MRRNNQKEYYKVLSVSDKSGQSTVFIGFMLDIINKTLRKMIELSKTQNIDPEYALSILSYKRVNKGISTATASRDLRQLLEEHVIG